ncbi:hypothetical protein HUSEC41_26984 [Escherichia coli O104:H4 str. 01-09591]|jgi:hypothetical protein|nr:hypothetical protein HUSEC41_26984 [Escherichia coli O104:H4 str. 01-09591]
MLQPPALEKFFKFPLHIARQFLSLLCHKRSECRVILVNDLIEKGLLGSVALVTTSIPIPAGRPGRHMRHVPRPCNTVFTYSLSLSGKFFYPQPKCLPLLDIASQCPSLLPDMLINFALINITDRKNEGTNTIDGNWQADERRRYRDNVRIYF